MKQQCGGGVYLLLTAMDKYLSLPGPPQPRSANMYSAEYIAPQKVVFILRRWPGTGITQPLTLNT